MSLSVEQYLSLSQFAYFNLPTGVNSNGQSQTPPACRWLGEWCRLKGDGCPAVLVSGY